ncbi:hypothetical protein PROCOU_04831 [Listeria rocourtiae FSL F6-920]|nr:hypothetical protein PROCOU_04831 [Listeria rocourtiae FSL F6-920]
MVLAGRLTYLHKKVFAFHFSNEAQTLFYGTVSSFFLLFKKVWIMLISASDKVPACSILRVIFVIFSELLSFFSVVCNKTANGGGQCSDKANSK